MHLALARGVLGTHQEVIKQCPQAVLENACSVWPADHAVLFLSLKVHQKKKPSVAPSMNSENRSFSATHRRLQAVFLSLRLSQNVYRVYQKGNHARYRYYPRE